MFEATFRKQNNVSWSFARRLGQEPPPAEPAPAPPPDPVCTKFGHQVQQGNVCSQVFECRHADGTVTYKTEPTACPPEAVDIRFRFPVTYPLFPLYRPPFPPQYAAAVTERPEERALLEDVAPYAIGAVGLAAILYLTGALG